MIKTIYTSILFLSIAWSITGCKSTQLASGKIPAKEFAHAAVVSAHPEASTVGLQILKSKGNAIDASIAIQYALAVVYPNAGNIGGGGFMVYRAADGEIASLDYRETAPQKASRDMYLDAQGNAITDLSLYGRLASGIPGTVAGTYEAHLKYGRLPWSQLLAPAIALAENGFRLTAMQAKELNERKDRFQQYNPHGTAFVKEGLWKAGDLLVQKELANTLKLIAREGRDGFYKGSVANHIVSEMNRGEGIISHSDLENYQAIWRMPILGYYRGHEIISMPPPSSGGTSLVALLKSVEQFPLSRWGFQSDSTVRVMVEASRYVYANRAKFLGDPNFIQVPTIPLMDSTLNASKLTHMSFNKATPSSSVMADIIPGFESEETTHLSVVDEEGNAVSVTTTLNGSYGSLVVVDGAGFLLNNEMDDFSVKAGVPNMYGLIGGKANAIAPNKRMLSSMTPTILVKDGKLFMVVGTPGGSTIITSVFQTILNVIDFGFNAQEAVSAPRFHHQWLPDEIAVEAKAIPAAVRQQLEQSGYHFKARTAMGRVEAIIIQPNGKVQTGADHRGDDSAKGY